MGISAVGASTVNASHVKPTVDKSSELYKVCLDFEAIFIKQMLNVMRKTVEKNGLLDGGMSEDIFEDMLYDEYANKMAQTAQFGLAETMYLQINHQK
jgi:flagellar protein FlgJ